MTVVSAAERGRRIDLNRTAQRLSAYKKDRDRSIGAAIVEGAGAAATAGFAIFNTATGGPVSNTLKALSLGAFCAFAAKVSSNGVRQYNNDIAQLESNLHREATLSYTR